MTAAESRISTGVEHTIRYSISAAHQLRDVAEGLGDEILSHIIAQIEHHPRSLQKRIGPSEMAIECERSILHKLNQDEEPPRSQPGWKPTMGTAMHAWLEDLFTDPEVPGNDDPENPRWLVEKRVPVGDIGGQAVDGSCDLYDTWSHTVLDWKLVGKYTHTKYRTHGPSDQYRGQANIYGRGYELLGYTPEMVAICFLPREGELADTYLWTEPYNRALAEQIIGKVRALAFLLERVGIEAALDMFDECAGAGRPPERGGCAWCFRGYTPARLTTAKTTADLFKK